MHDKEHEMNQITQLEKPVQMEMNQCREQFDSYMKHSNLLLNEVLQRIARRKGKMMRPLLTLLCAKLFGEINEKTIYTALTFEFFHTASLVHDDIVDESNERRGNPSVNSAYDNAVAVLVGDYILATALSVAAKTDSPKLVEILSTAAQELANGELLQLRNIHNREISLDAYFNVIKAKTAALFAASAEAGAVSVGADVEQIERLRTFGETVGICFQIKDDIFDYVAGKEIGKPTGNDMAEGKLTLPVIHVLQKTKNENMLHLAQNVKEGSVSSDEIRTLVTFTLENGGIEHAIEVMNDYASRAKQLLDVFPDSIVKNALKAYVDVVIERNN